MIYVFNIAHTSKNKQDKMFIFQAELNKACKNKRVASKFVFIEDLEVELNKIFDLINLGDKIIINCYGKVASVTEELSLLNPSMKRRNHFILNVIQPKSTWLSYVIPDYITSCFMFLPCTIKATSKKIIYDFEKTQLRCFRSTKDNDLTTDTKIIEFISTLV